MLHDCRLIPLDDGVAAAVRTALGASADAVGRLESLAAFTAAADERPSSCALVAIADAAQLDRAWWLDVRRRAPAARLLIVCATCSDETWRRWLVAGATNVLRTPLAKLDLEVELADEAAINQVFRRDPSLAGLGKALFRYMIPSDAQYVPGIVHVVSLWAMEFGFGYADHAMNLPLAVDEALSNAIIHGNRRDARKRVEIEGTIDAGMLRIRIRDEGAGFLPETRRHDPADPKALMASSGRGLFLIESVMDEVRYTEDGRCIEMRKRVPPPPS
jgi:serine/threonine-protein kinase RsbW